MKKASKSVRIDKNKFIESETPMTPEILYKTENVIVIYKPPLMPSQSDKSGETDALTLTSQFLRSSYERDELYLINRLDRVVGGLMIFARNKKYAAKLSDILLKEDFSKQYFAVADGIVEEGEMIDWLAKDSVTSKAIVKDSQDGAKEAILKCKLLDTVEIKGKVKSLFLINLKTGRFHQIRAQFSHRGAPLTGDKKYGSKDFYTRQPALFAYRILIKLDHEKIEVVKVPDITKYPWNLFSAEKYTKEIECK